MQVEGPAIIEQSDATTIIEPGAVATIDDVGNLRIKVGAVR
jgi:N-methylhydantoinase A